MRDVYSVTVVNRYIKQLIEGEGTLSHIYVRGEVSNCKYHTSGHIYFTLKDGGSAIACVMFSGQRLKGLKFRMTEGMQVVVFGSVSVYERDGRYQLYAAQILQEGVGYLYEKYEQLKGQLEAEGLFDAKYKKKLPAFPAKVGIVTASTGAAIQDILNISGRRNPYVQLVLYPAKVQGQGAAKTIVEGIHALDKYGVDVMIVGRGGGSIEDLWAFNEECVARAVFECQTPVISAVGHESDWTIVDYVSDLRAPTPSAAAELAVPDVITLMSRISEDYARMNRATSGYPKVREKLLELQQQMAATYDVIMDGRDIGTNILPNADIKIYLTASADERAARRCKEYDEKGIAYDYDKVRQDIIERDERDKNRATAPLKQAEDAVYLDTSDMNIQQVVDYILNLYREKCGA